MIFETARLVIRDFTVKDVEIVHDLVQEPEIYKYQHWGPNTKEDTINFIDMSVNQQKESPRKSYEMAIIDKVTNELIGALGIRVHNHSKGDIGYWVKHDLWGNGLATEATRGVLNFGFNTLNLNKISATASPDNVGSLRVLEKSGMKKEGYLKSDLIVRGEYRDSVLMAVLKDEFHLNNI